MKKQKTKYVILGLLTIRPYTGYEMKKFIEKSICHFWSESNGQLYPAINQLLKKEFITLEKKQKQGKKVSHLYSITEAGRVELKKWISESSERKNVHRDEELLKLFFGTNISSEEIIEVLQNRAERIKDELSVYAATKNEIEAHTHSPHYLYWGFVMKNGVVRAKAELRWCQETIKTLRSGGTA